MVSTRIEDRETPKEVYNVKVYMCAIIASFAAVLIGYDSAFISGSMTLPAFENSFGFNDMSTSEHNLVTANIVTLYQAGCFFGALFAYPIGYYWGRKIGLLIFSLFFFVGAGMQLDNHGLGVMYGGRFLAGISIGGCCSLTPIYVAEIAPPAIRGRLVGMYEVAWQVGGLVGFWLPYGVIETIPGDTDKQWRIPFGMQLLPCGLFFIGLPFLKESPRWLWTRGRNDQAIKNLTWLRNLDQDHPYVVTEINAMKDQYEHEKSLVGDSFFAPFREVFGQWRLFKRVILGSLLFMWQNGTGVNAINYYAPTVFKAIGVTGDNTSLLTTGVWGCIKTVVCMVWIYILIDRFGRRTLFLVGCLIASLCLFYTGAYVKIANPSAQADTGGTVSDAGISALFFFYLYVVFYGISWAGGPWVVGAEIFPGHVRTLTQALMAASNWFWTFLISRFTPDMFTGMNDYGPLLFFAGVTFVAGIFVFFFVPETKGIPLEAMDLLFDRGYPAWKAHRLALEEWHRITEANAVPDDEKKEAFVEEKAV